MAEPRRFPEVNINLVAAGCGDLPAETDGKQFLTCWGLTLRERLSALFAGKIWLCVQGNGHPPVWIRAEREVHEGRKRWLLWGGRD